MYELEDVDRFLAWSCQSVEARRHSLCNVADECGMDDRYGDDAAELESFANLYSEFAIVALWRCVELFRKRLLRNAFGAVSGTTFFSNGSFAKDLRVLGIEDAALKESASVNELRCLNNCIKHNRVVDRELARLPNWTAQSGEELVGLSVHYPRLRLAAEQYVGDLAERAAVLWSSCRK